MWLGYRLSKDVDKKGGSRMANWGTKVDAIDEGDDWVRVAMKDMP